MRELGRGWEDLTRSDRVAMTYYDEREEENSNGCTHCGRRWARPRLRCGSLRPVLVSFFYLNAVLCWLLPVVRASVGQYRSLIACG